MSTLSRRHFLKTAGAAGTGLLTGLQCLNPLQIQASNAANRKPNIIFIMADDLGYGDLGCYGQDKIQTPHLDRMAQEGMRFQECYAGSTVCAPSRCCLMTGYHTGHSHIRGNKRHPLLPEHATIAEVLQEAGYSTGIIGKWGLGEPDTSGVPNRQGFDYWFGYLNQGRAHNYYPDFLWKNEERFFFQRWTYSHNVFTEEALKFVQQNKDNPFFLYLPYTIPHAFNEGGVNGMPIPNDKPYSNKDWPQNEKNKAAMITLMDRDIGKIFALLKELGIDDDTIVFFTSDNGPHREGGSNPEFFHSSGPLRGIKRDLYEGGIRVPMIARWPGKIQAGSVSDQVWAFWDFPSTAAELGGAAMPSGVDGISMVNALLGKPQKSHDYLYWEFHEQGGKRAIRTDNWKAVRPKWNGPIELYDLKNDHKEANNIANAHPDIIQKMEELFRKARTDNEFYPVK
ncbi:MAG: sulfatase-like hydrolase/transferase [Candidatus Hinthialibacter sp.]